MTERISGNKPEAYIAQINRLQQQIRPKTVFVNGNYMFSLPTREGLPQKRKNLIASNEDPISLSSK